MNNKDVFQSLRGSWDIKRRITPGGVFTGVGVFEAINDDQYIYTETGDMFLDNGTQINAYRAYTYLFENGKISVYFQDGADKGSLFHTLDINENGQAIASHQCLEDHYASKYHFEMPEKFTVEHKVKGPKKDYILTTKLAKLT